MPEFMFVIIDRNIGSGGDAIGSTKEIKLVRISTKIFNGRSVQTTFIPNSLARRAQMSCLW